MSLDLTYNDTVVDDLDLQDRRTEISRLLIQHDCEVTFTKVDGTVSTMPCTLRPDVLPPRKPTKINETKAPNPDVISVWCLDKQQWRSFRVANVSHVKVLNV